jgi:predicted RNA-binding Zn-ribbon protein involved in translation (DUF1610 family)
MDELTRFARILVERLGARPAGGTAAVSVQSIRKEILPYRAERRNLGLASVEDYETVLLRLVAEERGFVKTVPPAAAERCREVLGTPNPDLGVLEEIADSTIQFTSLAAAPVFPAEVDPARPDGPAARRAAGQAARRPDGPTPAEPAGPFADGPTGRSGKEPSPLACPHCREPLPEGRVAVFCPWCGERLIPLRCERCGSEFESGWKHCITCGAPVRDPHRPA